MPVLYGTAGDDALNGLASDGTAYERIEAGAGNDVIQAAPGYQLVLPSQGNDTITSSGSTTLLFWDSPSSVVVDFTKGIANDGWGTVDHFSGVNNVHTTRFDDIVIGSSTSESILCVGGGNDVFDLGGGIDKVQFQVGSLKDLTSISYLPDGTWRVTYKTPFGQDSSLTLANCEVLIASDANWSLLASWELGAGSYLRTDTLSATAPHTIRTDLNSPSVYWRVSANPVYQAIVDEQHSAYFYPTANDPHPADYNTIDLLHNVIVGDANGDGTQDIMLNEVMFPHTVPHSLVKPILLANQVGTLAVDQTFSDAIQLGRQMSYRNVAADYNGDGSLDFVSSSMGLIQRNADGTYTNAWEPILSVLSNGKGGWTDGTAMIDGQIDYKVANDWGFGHDFAAGDINADGALDFYTGGRLFTNDGHGRFAATQGALPGSLTALTSQGYVMSSLLSDINRDGYADLMVWMADGISPQAFLFTNAGNGTFSSQPTALPEGNYGSGPTKFNYAITDDLNHDGWADVVVGETRSNPYYEGRSIQLLMNSGGVLKDETAARAGTDPRYGNASSSPTVGGGEGQTFLVDVNADGHTDIVDRGGSLATGSAMMRVLLNDGEGHFTDMDLAAIPNVQPSQIGGFLDTAGQTTPIGGLVPINLDGAFGIDWVGELVQPLRAWPQAVPTVVYAYTVYSTARYGMAGGGREGAELGAPGFDEGYYLLHHPEVAVLIKSGGYGSALDHYLKVGKGLGYPAFAPYTVVWGSNNGDDLVMQSGDETYQGGSGNDRVNGLGGNDTLDGSGGIDFAIYSGSRANFSVTKTASGYVVKDNTGTAGTDSLTHIERLEFADAKLAIDMEVNQSGGEAALLIGAVLGKTSLSSRVLVGQLISYFDAGHTLHDAADALVMSGILDALAGGSGIDAFVNMVYKSVTGQTATPELVAQLAATVGPSGYTKADFVTVVAGLLINQTNVGLVGLQQTGLDYQ